MIFEAAILSPSQKSAIEELVGRELLEHEVVTLSIGPPIGKAAPPEERIRAFRNVTDFSGHRLTDAEYEEALLEAASHSEFE